eukprot:jgi/Botrbrau1/12759/Bobra.67_1s0118.1
MSIERELWMSKGHWAGEVLGAEDGFRSPNCTAEQVPPSGHQSGGEDKGVQINSGADRRPMLPSSGFQEPTWTIRSRIGWCHFRRQTGGSSPACRRMIRTSLHVTLPPISITAIELLPRESPPRPAPPKDPPIRKLEPVEPLGGSPSVVPVPPETPPLQWARVTGRATWRG